MDNFYINEDGILVEKYIKLKNLTKDEEVWVSKDHWETINKIQQNKFVLGVDDIYQFNGIIVLKNDFKFRYHRSVAMKSRTIYEKIN